MTTSNSPPGPMIGSDILVEALVREGVRVIFAYPGGASMPIHQSLTRYKDKIRTILPRNEQGGGFAAEGYARVTGKAGVCLATSGPGATNFTTCLADAKMDSLPMVAITGQVPTRVIGTDAFQETPMVNIATPITKHHFLVQRTEDIPRVVKEAFYIAQSGRPGPVLIDVPKDIQQRAIVPDWNASMHLPGYKPDLKITENELDQVMEMIRSARKPIIYAGGGVTSSGAWDALREFAEKTRIPVTMTLQGLGDFPADHYLSLHMLGMHGTVYANYAVNEADLLLAWGVRFDDRVTGKIEAFCQHGKIIHIDIDPSELNKNKTVTLAIGADVRDAIERINRRLNEKPLNADYTPWHRQIDQWREDEPLRFEPVPGRILPQQAIRRLWEKVNERGWLERTIVTTGVGQHQMWAAQYWQFSHPRRWVTSGGLGSMGFGLPAAMGAQLAYPERLVIDVDGDGSFIMNIQELAALKAEKIPVKVLLLNNQHLGMVVQWEDRFFAGNRAHTYLGIGDDKPPYPDFVTICKGFGIPSMSISTDDDLEEGLDMLLDADGPFVLDVLVPHQEHVLPMIPTGMTVKDMIKA